MYSVRTSHLVESGEFVGPKQVVHTIHNVAELRKKIKDHIISILCTTY